ncbi:MAG: hypothetical protein AB7H43_08305 [Acidimicrobiia bacterium]
MTERRKGGRTTPKGTGAGPESTGRYTPPVHQPPKVSPIWVPVLMFALFGLGALTIVLNYMNLLPGDADSKYLVLGLLLVTGGFVTATNLH